MVFLPNGTQLVMRFQTRGPDETAVPLIVGPALNPSRSRNEVRDQSLPSTTGNPSTMVGMGTCGVVGAIPVGGGKGSAARAGRLELITAHNRHVASRFMSPPSRFVSN
jgi:hypothetical protein